MNAMSNAMEIPESPVPGPTILIVDDDRANLSSLEKIFQRESHQVLVASDGSEALEILRTNRVDVVLTDLMMPGMNGTDLLKAAGTVSPESDVILMTAFGTVETAVEAMKLGAYDFVTKPFKRLQVVRCVKRALEKQALLTENRGLRRKLEAIEKSEPIIGSSPRIRELLDLVSQVAPSSATVLLHGESGTGKEVIARRIHERSPRTAKPFIAINCAAIPENILESELFGYERGAFTGANNRKEGRFMLAHEGTLLLDEIGDISPAVQVKLLRVLQEGQFERLGGTQTLRVDVRIVAASKRDLAEEVRQGRFREDLYYRLNVIPIELPPLRDRVDDIPLLADHFLRVFAAKNQKRVQGIRRDAMEVLAGHSWPGNVRELENAMERAVVLSRNETIGLGELPAAIAGSERGARRDISVAVGTPLADVEFRLIEETLRMTHGDKRVAAQLLGIATRTIYRKLEGRQTE